MSGFLSPKQVAERLGVHRWTLRQWVMTGRFPQPRRLTKRTLRWPAAQVDAFLAGRKAAG